MYGNPTLLSNLVIQGLRPDGTADAGADLVAIVDFATDNAGCNLQSGFCTPGADISWYINDQFVGEGVAGGYNGGLGGYSVSSPPFIAPASGIIKISVKSQNQLDAVIGVSTRGNEPGQGLVQIDQVTCGNGPDYQCSCESNGDIIVYFSEKTVQKGSGTAYVDVYIDGELVIANNPTSTRNDSESVYDSVAFPCPGQDRDHTILVKGKGGDIGSSVILLASTPRGGYFQGQVAIAKGATPHIDAGSVTGNILQATILGGDSGAISYSVLQNAARGSSVEATVIPPTIAGVDTGTVAIVGGAAAVGLIVVALMNMKNR